MDAVAKAEKIAHRADDAGFRGIIPCDLDEHFPIMHVGGHPDMSDLAGPLDVRHHPRFAGLHDPAVSVPASGIKRGNSFRSCFF